MAEIAFQYVNAYGFCVQEGVPRYLVLRRSASVPMPGIWQCVTGSIEPGETAVQAAVREFLEETGLVPQSLWNVCATTVFYEWSRDRVQLSPNFGVGVKLPADVHLSGEHDAYCWTGIDEAIELVLWQSHKEAFRWLHETVVSSGNPHAFLRIPLP